jgi:hypothetical protein
MRSAHAQTHSHGSRLIVNHLKSRFSDHLPTAGRRGRTGIATAPGTHLRRWRKRRMGMGNHAVRVVTRVRTGTRVVVIAVGIGLFSSLSFLWL